MVLNRDKALNHIYEVNNVKSTKKSQPTSDFINHKISPHLQKKGVRIP